MNREELLLKWGATPTKVLDHGHVRLVNVMGDDEAIEQAARLSYQQGTRTVNDRRNLIRHLMRHRHTSPMEQAVISLDMRMPIFVARQLVRHRTQALNELSGRYSELPADFYIPDHAQVCRQSTTNKQGRAEPLPDDEAADVAHRVHWHSDKAFELYRDLLDKDVSRETARMHLPLSTYTHWQTTMSLHNLLHLLGLRMDPHAQWECVQFANAIAEIVKDWCPIVWEAFEDYRLEAHTFSKHEMATLRKVLGVFSRQDIAAAVENNPSLSKRERDDFTRALFPGEVP